MDKKQSEKWSVRIMAVLILLGLLYTCAHKDGPYKGKVIELETGKPIEGAVVAARWNIGVFAHYERTCDTAEALTDSNGEFILPTGWCITQPLTQIDKPRVVVFKPGYLGYPPLGSTQVERIESMPEFTGEEFSDNNQYYTIKLGKPKTREERELTMSHANFPILDDTVEKLPKLIMKINEERKNLGLKGEVYKKEK